MPESNYWTIIDTKLFVLELGINPIYALINGHFTEHVLPLDDILGVFYKKLDEVTIVMSENNIDSNGKNSIYVLNNKLEIHK